MAFCGMKYLSERQNVKYWIKLSRLQKFYLIKKRTIYSASNIKKSKGERSNFVVISKIA